MASAAVTATAVATIATTVDSPRKRKQKGPVTRAFSLSRDGVPGQYDST
jgi:hypothetical protein